MKRLMTVGAVILVVTALAMPALARGPGWGRGQGGYGPGYGNCPGYGAWDQNLTDEQRAQIDALHKKFFDSTATLRSQVWAKQGELQAIMSSPNPDVEKAKALQKDLSNLRAQMAQERLSLQLEERKINPDARFGGWGRGHGRGGPGPGMRYGRGMMGGYGPGGCWN
ncbi:MAG: Spy/CpxP family protein refolding chaperone [Thermodesulfobacteriota bacterium]